MANIRLTNVAIRDGLTTLKWQYENSETDYILVFKTGEYGKGQYRTEVNAINLLADTLELLKEQEKTIESLEDDLARTTDMLNHYLNGNE